MIEFELKGLKEVQDILDPQKLKKVVTRTLNKVGSQALTAASREIRSVYNIKKDRLDAGLKLTRVAIATSWESSGVIITAKGKPPGLQNFGARQTRKGVTVLVRKDHGRKVVEGGFMGKGVNFGEHGSVSGGKTGITDLIWKRTGEAKRLMSKGRYAGSKAQREPIKKLNMTDTVGMMNTIGTEAIKKVVETKMGQIFDHELDWEMGKK